MRQIRDGLAGRRDQAGRDEAECGEGDDESLPPTQSGYGKRCRHGKAARDRARKDGEEGRAFDERVGADDSSRVSRWSGRMPYLIGPKSAAMIPKPRSAANRSGMEDRTKPISGHDGDREFGKLDPARDGGFVVPIGQFAAERGEKDERDDQRRAGEGDEHVAAFGADAEDDQEGERVLDEVVVERGEELADEDRREALSTSAALVNIELSKILNADVPR
jgi:hypothetical protein